MAFCDKCGKQLMEGEKFCAACGNSVGAGGPSQGANSFNNAGNNMSGGINDLLNTPDTTGEYDPNDINANKGMAILAYIGILFLIPLLAAPQSKFARFHTNQGIILCIVEVGGQIILGILSVMLAFARLGFIGTLLSGLVGIASFVFLILGIVNAANGQAKELPLIGRFKILN